jgi:hypothetical protein
MLIYEHNVFTEDHENDVDPQDSVERNFMLRNLCNIFQALPLLFWHEIIRP